MEFSKLLENEIIIVEKKADQKVNYLASPSGTISIRVNKSTKFSDHGFICVFKKIFQEIFLPQGYPSSVSSDYMDYQIWDTVQAFCSTISGTLTTHAIFKGVGVGDSDATALAATITWIMKDGTGMMGRIGFAWWKGYLLDTDCKKWRLAADIINDGAMCVELLLGIAFFKHYSSTILCLSTIMKTVVGVAGGATRAAITQHQAKRGNMGDVSAKDGSQETCVNLFASLIGVFFLTQIENNVWSIWSLFFLSTVLHVYANYKAVRSLNIKTLNNSRLMLLVKHFLQFNEPGLPKNINNEESVFLGYGISDEALCSKKIDVGCSLNKFIGRRDVDINSLKNLKNMYNMFPYMIIVDNKTINVLLYENILEKDVIMAYFHALILGIVTKYSHSSDSNIRYSDEFRNFIKKCEESKSTEKLVSDYILQKWEKFEAGLSLNGWILNEHQLFVSEWRIKWH